MKPYVTDVVFVHTPDTGGLVDRLRKHDSRPAVTPALIDDWIADPRGVSKGAGHVVVCGPLETIKDVLKRAAEFEFSVGVVPTEDQKYFSQFYDLPKDTDAAVDLALRADPMSVDLLLCNGHVVLAKAVIGDMPLLDASPDVGRMSLLTTAFRRLFKIRLMGYRFATAGERRIATAAGGCMILNHHKGSIAANLIAGDSSISDGFVSTVISAPMSITSYLAFLLRLLRPAKRHKRLSGAIGYLKSSVVEITPEEELDVIIDGDKLTRTPARFEVRASALRINVPGELATQGTPVEPARERIDVAHLPQGKELQKALKKDRVPFFSYASEDRFRDLFTALREDAEVSKTYLMLMFLSTMLAAAGLYLSSASVIIGAMLLAPLMAPIVSLAMGMLRGEEAMIRKSLIKILIGMAIALLASATLTLLFPDKPVTVEMQARLNPTLLDLAVAIISGIAAAYSKSFKEIIQSLAGVAIAVALVPPLAVAGTGIGRGDFHFFFQAFLLFLTNLTGIVVAAALTFRVLGFSAAFHSKRSLGIVFILLALISVPLYISYEHIVQERIIEKRWKKERFLINGKYVIVEQADLRMQADKKIVVVDVVMRDVLTREDLNEFKKKISTYFPGKLIVRTRTVYIP